MRFIWSTQCEVIAEWLFLQLDPLLSLGLPQREREREIAKWLFLQLDPLLSLGLPERERERNLF